MRPALYLLLTLLSCWHVLSAGLDPGSGDGPVGDSSHSSSGSNNGASSTIRHPTEGSGDVVLTDDEDDVIPAAATTAAATSAATASTSRSLVTGAQASDNDEGSGVGVVTRRCDPGASEPSGCYCVDEANREIPGTRGRTSCEPVEEEIIVPVVASTYGRSVSPSLSSTTISTNEIDIDADTTSTVSESTPAATSTMPTTVSRTSAAAAAQTTGTTTTAVPTTAVPSTLATATTTMPPPTTMSMPTRVATHKVTVAAARHATSTVRHAHTQPTTTLSNEIPYVKDASNGDDAEEKTNEINAAAEPLNRGASHIASGGLHPGLLAAIIGGGVVGLLCAILLIMFIVYRMRKKDEGSYPLDDGKPRALYKSPPSKEFYA